MENTKTNTTNNVIEGDIFIIPNSPVSIPKEGIEYYDLSFYEKIDKQYTILKVHDSMTLKDNITDDKFVQIWYVTRGNSESNWYDHHIDQPIIVNGKELNSSWKPVSQYLPASLFKGKKEGDVVEFTMLIRSYDGEGDNALYMERRQKVRLTLCQSKYRYRNYGGSFEKALSNLI